jgi:transcriptional antiterminator
MPDSFKRLNLKITMFKWASLTKQIGWKTCKDPIDLILLALRYKEQILDIQHFQRLVICEQTKITDSMAKTKTQSLDNLLCPFRSHKCKIKCNLTCLVTGLDTPTFRTQANRMSRLPLKEWLETMKKM